MRALDLARELTGNRQHAAPQQESRASEGSVTIRQRLAGIAHRGGIPLARVIEEHAERAAIREYLGGMAREEAEIAAVDDTCDMLGVPR